MAQPDPSRLLDPVAISRAESLGLNARYIVEGYMAGEHQSPYRGFAVEFAQHREYTHGDDPRHLDWKVFGRTDRYYIKQYEQETNYVAHVLLDGSESMKYGSGALSKLHYGKMIAACLAYLILHQRDAVALALFDTTVRDYTPRSDNLATIHKLMTKLAAFEPQVLDGIQHLRFGGNEVVVFHVMDPYELEFPFTGLVEFEGLEQIPKLLTRPAEIRRSYLREVEAFRRRIRDGCEKNQCHYTLVNTAQPLQEMLSAYLAFRLRKTR